MQGSDNRLGIGVQVTGVDAAEQQIRRLRDQLAALRAQITSNPEFGAGLAQTIARTEAQVSGLTYKFLQQTAAIEGFNVRAIAAMRGSAEAVKGVATELGAQDRILRAGSRSGQIYTQTIQQAIAANDRLAQSRAISAGRVANAEAAFAFGSNRVSASASQANEREIARLRATQQRVAGAQAVMFTSPSAQSINSTLGLQTTTGEMLALGQAGKITEEEVTAAFGRMGRSAKSFRQDLEESGGGETRASLSRFMRGGRTPVSLFDETMRGQRGQMMATLGAGFGAAGVGGVGMAVVGGAAAAVGTAVAVEHLMKSLGELNETIAAGAHVTGMSVEQFARLQGALMLTGDSSAKAGETLRMFADHIGVAMANPANSAAKALHAIGISQGELAAKGQNTAQMLKIVIDALNRYGDSATKAEAMKDIFGRSDAEISRLIENYDKLTAGSASYARSIALNNQAARKMDESINTLSLSWKTFEESAIPALTTVLNAVNAVTRAIKGMFSGLENFISSSDKWLVKTNFLGWGEVAQRELDRHKQKQYKAWAGNTDMDLGTIGVTAKPLIQPYATPKAHAASPKQLNADLAEERAQLQGLTRDYQLAEQQQRVLFERQTLQAHIARADKNISPVQQATLDLAAAQNQANQKLAAIHSLQAASDAIYDEMIAKSAAFYGADSAQARRVADQKINADKEWAIQAEETQNQVLQSVDKLVAAHEQAVQQVVAKWGSAFDRIGDQIETTIGTAIKSAFEPMKPEYWWSSVQGPHGQPLMESHRINPTAQLLGGLGMSALGDLGKTLLSSIGSSLAKSFSSGTESTFGGLIAKSIGIGTKGGLLGTGIGAVTGVSKDAAQLAANTMITTQLPTQTSLLVTIASALGVSNSALAAITANTTASATSSAGSALGGIGGFISGIPVIGSLFGGLFGAGAAGGAGAAAGALGALALSSGGIVPAAAGGWSLPRSFGTDRVLSALTPGETVLPVGERPSQIAKALGDSKGGDMHLHLHSTVMDAPSMSRWFQNMMVSNSGAVRSMFRQNALTPRSF